MNDLTYARNVVIQMVHTMDYLIFVVYRVKIASFYGSPLEYWETLLYIYTLKLDVTKGLFQPSDAH